MGSLLRVAIESVNSGNAGYACNRSHTVKEIAARVGAVIKVVPHGESTDRAKPEGEVI